MVMENRTVVSGILEEEHRTITPQKGIRTAHCRGRKDKIRGIKVYLKGSSPTAGLMQNSPYYERAAYIINVMLGLKLVPPTILYLVKNSYDDGKDELMSAMKLVRGKRPSRREDDKPIVLDVFDYIIANTDRHDGNWLIKPSGRVWAIDNAYAFNTDHVYEIRDTYQLPVMLKRTIKKIVKNPKELRGTLLKLITRAEINDVLARMKYVLEQDKENKSK